MMTTPDYGYEPTTEDLQDWHAHLQETEMMSTSKRTWTDPYRQIIDTERKHTEYSIGVQDGEYCKAWKGYCPRYSDQRTKAYCNGFKQATGQTPEEWDRG